MNIRFPFWLTLVIIIPFVMMSLAIAFDWAASTEVTLQMLLVYSAIIFSFLAGIHWGLAVPHIVDKPNIAMMMLAESTIAVLLAWLIMYIDETYLRLLSFAFLYAIIWGIDSLLFNHKIIPLWFFNLRGIVTPIVVVCMYVTYFSII